MFQVAESCATYRRFDVITIDFRTKDTRRKYTSDTLINIYNPYGLVMDVYVRYCTLENHRGMLFEAKGHFRSTDEDVTSGN